MQSLDCAPAAPNWCAIRGACFALPFTLVLLLHGCATPRVQATRPSQETPRLTASAVVMADGLALPLTVWRPAGAPQAVVLALHGFNDYRNAFAGVGPFLARQGTITYAYDQRGFGATHGRGIWAGAHTLVEDARTVAVLLHQRHPQQPLFILGESMGGAVAAALLGDAPPPYIAGAVLASPAVLGGDALDPVRRVLLWLAAHTLPNLEVTGDSLELFASNDRETLRALAADPLVLKQARIDTVYGLVRLMDRAVGAAARVSRPLLLLYGGRDDIMPPHAIRSFANTLWSRSSAAARLVLYPEGCHMLMRDLQRRIVLRDIAAWIHDPRQPLPSGQEVEPASEAPLTNGLPCSPLPVRRKAGLSRPSP